MRALLVGLSAALTLLAGCGPAPCGPGGTGTLVVNLSGLPAGVSGTVTLAGAGSQTLTSSQTLSAAASGDWTVTAEKATAADPRVRTAYAATISASSFCLASGGRQTVDVAWTAIPTSNKVWMTNGTGGTGELLGFGSATLAASGAPAAAVSAKAPAGRDVAFDQDGNLWAMGPTTVDPMLVRFPASALGASGTKTKDRGVNIAGVSCLPGAAGLAFDASGSLWVSSPCGGQVVKLTADQLSATTANPALVISGLTDPQGLAFDSAGNLWVADPTANAVLRYDAAQLTGASVTTPALKLQPRVSDNPSNTALLRPAWVAFDAAGALWSNDFGGNVIFRLPPASLTGTGTVSTNPSVRVTIGVAALLEGMAIDEGGGLWTALSAGKFARLSPSQLTVSTGAGAPTVPETVVSSSDVGYAANLALFPAPAASPLFHRLP